MSVLQGLDDEVGVDRGGIHWGKVVFPQLLWGNARANSIPTAKAGVQGPYWKQLPQAGMV